MIFKENNLPKDLAKKLGIKPTSEPTIEPVCWFCEKRQSTKSTAYHVPIYSVGSWREKNYVVATEVTTRYKSSAVSIPRCYDCKLIHEQARSYAGNIGLAITIGCAVVGLGIALLALAMQKTASFDMGVVVVAVVVGGIIGAVIAHNQRRSLIDKAIAKSAIKSTHARESYPALNTLLNPDIKQPNVTFWNIGNKPNEWLRWDD